MSAEKTTRRKKKTAPAAASGIELWTKDDPRKERRYEPKAASLAIASTLGMSIGAVLVGAGVYGQWLRAAELGPHKAAPYLLGAGALLLIAVALFGQRLARPIRVGDAGIALEKDGGELDRLEWRDVTRLLVGDGALTVQGAGVTVVAPLDAHRLAAARIFAEAKRRIPKKVADVDGAAVGEPADDGLEQLALDPPQVAGQHCKESDKLIAFEKDARFCGRCGEVYHKDHVPGRCLTCDARLRA